MNAKICVLGLGYVGLPLAVALAQHFPVIGFDVKKERIEQLQNGIDSSGEISKEILKESSLVFSFEPSKIKETNFIIVCVPTPVDNFNKPDLYFMESASKLVGENLSKDSIVVFESTVYPGVTEDVCQPILEQYSGLKCGTDFKIGYSPERMNPGDKEHTIKQITKIVSGMDIESLDIIDKVYSKVTKTYRAQSIKVAEAAKVIENIQRDINIALMNELAIIFDRLKIDTTSVLDAASTKWNFQRFHPGLVGGHCISIDPYYLTYIAENLGYHPEVILAGRRINDNMHKFYAEKILKKLQQIKSDKSDKEAASKGAVSKVAILGLTFKPDVQDCRNSRVKYLIKELQEYNVDVKAYDPYVSKEETEKNFNTTYVELSELLNDTQKVDLIVLVTEHKKLLDLLAKDNRDQGHNIVRLSKIV
ncbi:nucleotide sugar dehydrogenase [Candidatus Woesearchaeota archaeon]|nr:nucleotide sugar dehydrogenase [Candidatus Woesearchaeota archaeon]